MGYTRKLSQEEANRAKPIIIYIPHHDTQNPNKPGKLRVVFDAVSLISVIHALMITCSVDQIL